MHSSPGARSWLQHIKRHWNRHVPTQATVGTPVQSAQHASPRNFGHKSSLKTGLWFHPPKVTGRHVSGVSTSTTSTLVVPEEQASDTALLPPSGPRWPTRSTEGLR